MPVRIIEQADAVLAGVTLAQAFQNEPLSTWQVPDPDQRAVLLPGHFQRVVRLAQLTGEVWCTDGFEAISCWLAPGRWPPTRDELTTSGMAEVEQLIGPDAWRRFEATYEAMDKAHERAIQGPHWDLWVLGVRPEAQGQGLASQLLTPMLGRLDAAGESCYLETLDERTLHLYVRLGFEVVIEEVEPVSGLRFWCCVRNRSASAQRAEPP